MRISDAQLRTRETFLLSLLDLQGQIWDYEAKGKTIRESLVQRADSLKSIEGTAEKRLEQVRAFADSAKARAARLTRIRRDIYRLAAAFNGRGVRQGSLYPPTQTHRMRQSQLEDKMRQELDGLKEMEMWQQENVAAGNR